MRPPNLGNRIGTQIIKLAVEELDVVVLAILKLRRSTRIMQTSTATSIVNLITTIDESIGGD